jgi:SAM-dependent methyltransferase
VSQTLTDSIREYWTENLHDMAIVRHSVGDKQFFDDLDEYHFDKQRHLAKVLDYTKYRGKDVLDLGCGVGVDLVRFAQAGAVATGVDISERVIHLAKKNFQYQGLAANLVVMDGEHLDFPENSFDFIYAHGILPYAQDEYQLVREIHRVLRPGAEALLQAYHKYSWMYLLRNAMKVRLEHERAPVFRVHTVGQIKEIIAPFKEARITYERFPVKTRLHSGLKGAMYNLFFVDAFNAIPRTLVRRFGWHIIVQAVK